MMTAKNYGRKKISLKVNTDRKQSVELLKSLTRTNRMKNRCEKKKKDRQYVVMASIKAQRKSKRIHTRRRIHA